MQEAAEVNRLQEQLNLAEAVALGIAEAFNPQAKILTKLRAILVPQENSGSDLEPVEPDPQAIASLFGGVPLLE